MTQVYNLLKVERFERDGEQKSKWREVGTAFAHNNDVGSFTLRIPEGVCITGDVLMKPRMESSQGEE